MARPCTAPRPPQKTTPRRKNHRTDRTGKPLHTGNRQSSHAPSPDQTPHNSPPQRNEAEAPALITPLFYTEKPEVACGMDPRHRIPETAVELRTEKDPEKGRARIQTEGKHTKTLSTNGSRCIVWNVVLHSEPQKQKPAIKPSPAASRSCSPEITETDWIVHRKQYNQPSPVK